MMTQYEYRWANSEEYQNMKNRFSGFEQEGLISLNDQGIKVLDKGHPFLRNVCSKFDDYYQKIKIIYFLNPSS